MATTGDRVKPQDQYMFDPKGKTARGIQEGQRRVEEEQRRRTRRLSLREQRAVRNGGTRENDGD